MAMTDDERDALLLEMNGKLNGLVDRVDQIETRIGRMETRVGRMEIRVGRMETQTDRLETKIDRIGIFVQAMAGRLLSPVEIAEIETQMENKQPVGGN